MANTGNDIAHELGDTFNKVISSPVDAVSGLVDKAKNFVTGNKPAQDTSWHDDMVKKANDSFKNAPNQPTPKTPAPRQPALKSFKDGTDNVTKTGPAKLHKGEAVLKKDDADKYRKAKGKDMSKESVMKEAASSLAGKPEEKPKKEISHIVTHKAKGGAYVHEHHHTHPEHHPVEHHVSKDQDEMASHMLQHMGEPNPGEAEADAGQSGIPGAAGAPQAGAAPVPGAAPAGAPPAAVPGM